MKMPSKTTIFYIILPLSIIGSFVFSIINGYVILNLMYYILIFGVLGAWLLLGARQESRKVDWQKALKNIEPISHKFKVSHSDVTPRVEWGMVRSDMKRYSSSGKVWDVQLKYDKGNAAIVQDRKTGDILGFDLTVGERQSPIKQGMWETNLPPQYTGPSKETVEIKKKSETQ